MLKVNKVSKAFDGRPVPSIATRPGLAERTIICDGGSTDGSIDIIRRYTPYLAHWTAEPDGGPLGRRRR